MYSLYKVYNMLPSLLLHCGGKDIWRPTEDLSSHVVRGAARNINKEGRELTEVNWGRTGLIILHWAVKRLVVGLTLSRDLQVIRNHPCVCPGSVPGKIKLPQQG